MSNFNKCSGCSNVLIAPDSIDEGLCSECRGVVGRMGSYGATGECPEEPYVDEVRQMDRDRNLDYISNPPD